MPVLAGDIGGTHARLALFEPGTPARLLRRQTLPSQEIGDLGRAVAQFLAAGPERPTSGCLAVAGPVVDGAVTGTNLPWTLRATELARELELPRLLLLNDFAAIAYGIPELAPADVRVLQEGVPDPQGVIGLIGAGTGLGQAFLVPDAAGWRVFPSEGGHATYAPEDARAWELATRLRERYGHVSWERVVSGPGIVASFEHRSRDRESPALTRLRDRLVREDPGVVITEEGLAGSEPLAAETLELFLRAYGAQAGNLALTLLATGGIYLAGALSRSLAPRLAGSPFLEAFRAKGRLRPLLERIPLRVILNVDVGLLGAAVLAARP